MSGKFPSLGDFDIPTELIDLHEWVADAFIDDEFGHACQLVYPQQDSQCPNCIRDPKTKQSSGIYNGTGPFPFEPHTVCPYCGGAGREVDNPTDPIRLRIYWDRKSWIDIGVQFDVADSVAMTIGYMVDLPKVEKAEYIILEKPVEGIRRWAVERLGEAVPWGFHHDRYFLQYVRRLRGG